MYFSLLLPRQNISIFIGYATNGCIILPWLLYQGQFNSWYLCSAQLVAVKSSYSKDCCMPYTEA